MDRLSPTITVGMPVFNGEKHIRQAIESVLTQTRKDFELLISDNASTDGTTAICREYAARDRRIRLVVQESNRGAFWNFKFVTDQAKGGFLVWLAHDDALEKQYLEESVAHLIGNSQVVLVCGDVTVIDDSGTPIDAEALVTIRADINWRRRCGEFYKYPISNVLFSIYGTMRTVICRQVLDAVKPRKQMAQFELPILARFAAKGQIVSLPTILRSYRKHGASLYNTEADSLSRKSRVKRLTIGHLHVARLRIDQVAVLLFSSMPPGLKLPVLLDIAKFYCRRLARKICGASAGRTG